jgi:DNA uptake protein ComE-like DNA-binding protein
MNQVKVLSLLLTIGLACCVVNPLASAESSVLDANTASVAEIASLPHMDELMAEVVVANRPFVTIGELHDLLISDLDEEQLAEIYGRLFVRINLNHAKRSDILLIPGVGSRMAHEFEEYRPYSSVEQFRREMGKYVDEAEVARLEQYVTLE